MRFTRGDIVLSAVGWKEGCFVITGYNPSRPKNCYEAINVVNRKKYNLSDESLVPPPKNSFRVVARRHRCPTWLSNVGSREKERIMGVKHTPGPWTCGPKEGSANSHIGFYRMMTGANGSIICHLWPSANDATDANANLIAAAPDLLEACKCLLWHYETFRDKSPVGDTERDDIESCKAAIRKAEGAYSS